MSSGSPATMAPRTAKTGPSALVRDSAGNIYVTGWSTGNGTDYDWATIKYSNAGEQLWLPATMARPVAPTRPMP